MGVERDTISGGQGISIESLLGELDNSNKQEKQQLYGVFRSDSDVMLKLFWKEKDAKTWSESTNKTLLECAIPTSVMNTLVRNAVVK